MYVFVCAWCVEVRQNYSDHDSSAIISLQKQDKKDDFECGSEARVEEVTEEVKVEEVVGWLVMVGVEFRVIVVKLMAESVWRLQLVVEEAVEVVVEVDVYVYNGGGCIDSDDVV